jgi:hypothetical protein
MQSGEGIARAAANTLHGFQESPVEKVQPTGNKDDLKDRPTIKIRSESVRWRFKKKLEDRGQRAASKL